MKQTELKRMRYLGGYLVLTLALGAVAVSAQAKTAKKIGPADKPTVEGPTLLGTYKDWSALSRGSGDGKVCYALSEPKSEQPDNVKRDAAYFLINDWPGRHARGESEIVPGYRYQDSSTVTIEIGKEKFVFFTKNDATAGSAWVLNPADDAKLLKALRGGSTATVMGTSRRGTKTIDTYGLSGFSEAIARIHDDCGM